MMRNNRPAYTLISMRTPIVIINIVLLLSVYIRPSFAEGPDRYSAVHGLINEAVKNNPELRALEEKIHAYEQKPAQARSLDDPMLKMSIANLPLDTFRFDQEAMTQKQISLSQRLPFPGKRELRGGMAERDLAAAGEEYNEKKNIMAKQIKIEYNNLLFLEKAIELTSESRDLLTDAIKTAETQYAVGRGNQQDIVKARMELSRTIRKIISLRQKQAAASARLNTMLNRPVEDHIDISGDLEQTPLMFSFEELRRIAQGSRPALKGLEHKIGQSRLARKLAEKDYYPDMDFGVSYGQRDDLDDVERPDFFSASVAINIPLWFRTKENSRVSEEMANERRAEEQYKAMKNSIDFRLKELTAEIDSYGQEIELLMTGLIPQSALSYEASVSGYEVNKIDFPVLINNQISLYNYKIDYYRAVADYENSFAELEETAGRALYPAEQ